MLCVSAVFAVARCMSVHTSVRLGYCIYTAEDIVKLLSHPGTGSPITLVFLPQRWYPIPRGTPSTGAQLYTGEGKVCDIRLKSPLISETK